MRLLAVLTLTSVSGCAGSAAEERAADPHRCFEYGFVPNKDAFARCMMAADHGREDQAAADHAAFRRQQVIQRQQADNYGEAFQARLPEPPASPRPPASDPFVYPAGKKELG